jgi:hypothetical protein
MVRFGECVMKNYAVTLRFQYPAYNERDGLLYHVKAATRADAIRHVRRIADRDGITGWAKQGRVTITARCCAYDAA